jgi:hypothetical protein
MLRARLAAACVLITCAYGCGDAEEFSVLRSPDYALPGQTLEDWVSYGDQLSVISVTDEREAGLMSASTKSKGVVTREVELTLRRTLWRRAGAPRADRRFRVDVLGWSYRGDRDSPTARSKLVEEHAPRLEVGHRYLAVLVRLGGDWTPLRGSAVMTLSGNVVTSEVIEGEPEPAASRLRGATLAQAAALVSSTPPDPAAARHFDLPPRRRLQAALR